MTTGSLGITANAIVTFLLFCHPGGMLDQADRALTAGAAGDTPSDGAWPKSKAPTMLAGNLTDEILEVLSEAAVEIGNLSSPDNIVCRRLRGLQRKLSAKSVTVGELARRIDISPRDVLDAAIATGIRPFWYEGQQFRDVSYLKTFLRMRFHNDPVPYVEFNLSPELAGRLADELSVTPEELLAEDEVQRTSSALGPRKFVTSESRLPSAADRRREQTG